MKYTDVAAGRDYHNKSRRVIRRVVAIEPDGRCSPGSPDVVYEVLRGRCVLHGYKRPSDKDAGHNYRSRMSLNAFASWARGETTELAAFSRNTHGALEPRSGTLFPRWHQQPLQEP